MENKKRCHGARGKLWCILAVLALYTINAFLIGPQITTLLSNVLYANSLLPVVLNVLSECLEVCAVAICYALVLVALYNGERAEGIFITFGLLTFYKYIAYTLYSWMTAGSSVKIKALDIVWSIVDDLYFTLLEMILLVVIFVIARKIITAYNDKILIAQRVNEKAGENVEVDEAYPFKRVYDKSNCLLRSAYICAFATFITKLIGKMLFSDLVSIIEAGLPKQWQTWLYMLLDYAKTFAFGVIVYFTIYLTLKVLLKKNKT